MEQVKISAEPVKIDRFWIWLAGKDDAYVLVEDNELAVQLLDQFDRAARYERQGKILAWQFIVPIRIVPLLLKRFARIMWQSVA